MQNKIVLLMKLLLDLVARWAAFKIINVMINQKRVNKIKIMNLLLTKKKKLIFQNKN